MIGTMTIGTMRRETDTASIGDVVSPNNPSGAPG